MTCCACTLCATMWIKLQSAKQKKAEVALSSVHRKADDTSRCSIDTAPKSVSPAALSASPHHEGEVSLQVYSKSEEPSLAHFQESGTRTRTATLATRESTVEDITRGGICTNIGTFTSTAHVITPGVSMLDEDTPEQVNTDSDDERNALHQWLLEAGMDGYYSIFVR